MEALGIGAVRGCLACRLLSTGDGLACPHCGAALPTEPDALIDGRYHRLREIGRGAMGTVLLAEDVALQRRVAIKMVGGEGAPDSAQVKAFHAEAAALATVRNAHVAEVFAFGIHGARPFFVMEFVEGAPLDQLVRPPGPREEAVPVYRVLSIARDVARGLSAVHAAGVIHCDVKPSNVVIEARTGRAVLVDFGIAVRQAPVARSGALPIGTPAYMSPEQIVPDSVLSPQTDVYGLGCTLYELLTGEPPFRATSPTSLLARHLHETPPPPSASDRRYAPLDPVLARAVARDPADRYESAAAFAHALGAVIPRFSPTDAVLARGPAGVPAPTLAPESATRPVVHAMVVDDDRAFGLLASQALKGLFKNSSLELSVARDGTEALAMAVTAPHLMVLDQHMPGLPGTELLAMLRERPFGAAMRVLVCSAAADARAQARFRLLGVTDFCPKPMHYRALTAAIRALAVSNGLLPREPADAPAG